RSASRAPLPRAAGRGGRHLGSDDRCGGGQLALAFAAPLAGRLADRLPPGPMAFTGMVIMASGLLLLATLPSNASILDIGWRMALCGIGLGIFQKPTTARCWVRHLAIAAAPPAAWSRRPGIWARR